MTLEYRLFTRVTLAKAKSVVADLDEPADPKKGSGFAEWAMLTLHTLRIKLGKSYSMAMDLLSEMTGVLAEIGLTRLSHYTVLRTRFVQISIKRWWAFLGVGKDRAGLVVEYPSTTLTPVSLEQSITAVVDH